jgi:putative ABC transport system permease protein
MGILISVINQGLIFSLVAVAVFLTSRVIKKDDLSVEGSFGLGGALTALLLEQNFSSPLSMLAATLAGISVGSITGYLHSRLKMNHLMAGLVSTTACFSLSLALATATKNIASEHTIFALIPGLPEQLQESLVLVVLVCTLLIAVLLFLRSEIGLILRASGDNPALLAHFGKSTSKYQTLGFALANGLTALAGSLFVQWSGFFSITGTVGTLVAGLASLMMAELFHRKLSFMIILASIMYQGIFAITMSVGIAPVWNNFIKAGIIVLLVTLSLATKNRRILCLK